MTQHALIPMHADTISIKFGTLPINITSRAAWMITCVLHSAKTGPAYPITNALFIKTYPMDAKTPAVTMVAYSPVLNVYGPYTYSINVSTIVNTFNRKYLYGEFRVVLLARFMKKMKLKGKVKITNQNFKMPQEESNLHWDS